METIQFVSIVILGIAVGYCFGIIYDYIRR
jgi:hypothetical protein